MATKHLPAFLSLTLLAIALAGCEKSSSSDSASPASAGPTSTGGDLVVTGTLAVGEMSGDTANTASISLAQREVAVKDASGNKVAVTTSATDGSYVVLVPGSLAVDTAGGLGLTTAPGLVLESIVADSADGTVIGMKNALDFQQANGRALQLGTTPLQKITALRGKIILNGIADSTGISIYIPGTSFAARTDGAGNFLMTFLSPGSYVVRAEKDGFTPLDIKDVQVTENETTQIPAMAMTLSGGTSSFSVKQIGNEGLSRTRVVEFLVSPGSADRFKGGLINDVEAMAYGPVPELFRYEFSADGTYTIKLSFANADGFEASAVRTIIVDTVPPSATAVRLADRNTLNTSVTNERTVIAFGANCFDIDAVAITAMQDNHPPAEDAFIYDCLSSASDSDAHFRLPEDDSSYNYRLWVKDKVGNISKSSASGSIAFDATPPSSPLAVISDQTSGSTLGTDITVVNVSLNSCLDVAKVLISESQTSTPAPNQFVVACSTAANAFSHTFANNSAGAKTIYVWAMDLAGNVGQVSSSAQIILDQTEPFAPNFVLQDPTSNSQAYTNETTVKVIPANCDDVTQVLVSESQTVKPTELNPAWQPCSPTGVTATLSAQGLRTLYLWAKDIGGNISTTGKSATITLDQVPPSHESVAFSLKDPSSLNSIATNETTVQASIATCSSDVNSVYLSEGVTAPLESDFSIACPSGTIDVPFTFSNGTNQTKSVQLWIKDIAGNISQTAKVDSIILDTTDPQLGTALLLRDESTDTTLSTNATALKYEVDFCPAEDYLLLQENLTSAPGENDSKWQACALSGTWSQAISAGGTTKTVYLWKKDEAGNITGSLSDTILWDNDAPTQPTVNSPSSPYFTTQSSVQVGGNTEANSLMTITGGLTTATSTAGGDGSYSATVSLTANAGNYLQVTAADAPGNISTPAYLQVYYDTMAPDVDDGTVTLALTDSTANISWNHVGYDYYLDYSSKYFEYGTTSAYGSDVIDAGSFSSSHSVALTGLAENTTYYFRIRSIDRAGNRNQANDYTGTFKTYIVKSGTMAANETWAVTDTAYYISNNLTVDSGVTLTIGPGVKIRFGSQKSLTVSGELNARGTAGNEIEFTANATSPSNGYWKGIIFASGSTAVQLDGSGNWQDGNVLEHTRVAFGGYDDSDWQTLDSAIKIANTGVALLHTTVNHAGNYVESSPVAMNRDSRLYIRSSTIEVENSGSYARGVQVFSGGAGGLLDIRNSTIKGISGWGRQYLVYMGSGAPDTLIFMDNTISGCGGSDTSNYGACAYIYGSASPNVITFTGNTIVTRNDYTVPIQLSGFVSFTHNTVVNSSTTMPSFRLTSTASNKTNTIEHNVFVKGKPAISVSTGSATGLIFNTNYNHFIENSSNATTVTAPTWQGPGTAFNLDNDSNAGGTFNFNNNLFYKNVGYGSQQSVLHLYKEGASTYTYTIAANSFIDNGTPYWLYNLTPSSAADINAQGNWWGTTDTTTINNKIFDESDDNAYSAVDISNVLSAEGASTPIPPPVITSVSAAASGEATISWQPNSLTSVPDGYRIYYSTTSGFPYSHSIDVGSNTNHTLTGLNPGAYYYFAVSSLKASATGSNDIVHGRASWLSQESSGSAGY